jgi:hypothetical protein
VNKSGMSTCKVGEEKWEQFYDRIARKDLVQYDFRNADGQLFSCIAPTLEKAREKRERESHG